jgi:hypothetical protein
MSNAERTRGCELQYRESRNGKCPADVRRVTSALIRCRAWDLQRANAFVIVMRPMSTSPRGLVAVLDMGASAIRLVIAEIAPDGSIRTLDEASRSVLLGRDTFASGTIRASTIDDALTALDNFRHILSRPSSIQSAGTPRGGSAAARIADRRPHRRRVTARRWTSVRVKNWVNRSCGAGHLRLMSPARLPAFRV